MYESFFGLSQRPFPAAPVARRYFPGTSIDAARTQLLRCLQRGEGPALVVGGPGLGKTLLLLVVAEQLQEQFPVALLTSGLIRSRKELLQTLLEAVGEEELQGEEADLRLRLTRRLSRDERFQRGVLLLVDEAHTLQPPLLDELRMLTNLARDGEPVVRLVLAGTMRLEEHLGLPELESLNQRLALRCYLECFDKAETADYVRFELAVSGGQAEHVFQPDAYDTIYQATDGVPRLINQVCDHALLLAQARGIKPVPAALIQEAWSQLQQLPTPWTEPAASASGPQAEAAVIEFGSLEDEPEETPGEAAETPQPQPELETPAEELPAPVAEEPEPPSAEAAPQAEDQPLAPAEATGPEEPAFPPDSPPEPSDAPPPSAQEEQAAEEPSEPEPPAAEQPGPEQESAPPPAFARGSLDIQMTLEQIDQTWQQLLADSAEAPAEAAQGGDQEDHQPSRQAESPLQGPPAETAVEETVPDEETDPEAESRQEEAPQEEQATPPTKTPGEQAPEAEESPALHQQAAACADSPEAAKQFEEEIIEDLYAALDARERQAASGPSAARDEHREAAAEESQAPTEEAPSRAERGEPAPSGQELLGASGQPELQVHLGEERVQVVVDPYAGLAGCEAEAADSPAVALSPGPEPEPTPPKPEVKIPLSQALREPTGEEEAPAEESHPDRGTPPPGEASPVLESARESLPELEIHGSGIVLIDEEEEDDSEALDVWPIPRDQLAEAFDQLQGRKESESP